jgi:hypothetical protein
VFLHWNLARSTTTQLSRTQPRRRYSG